MSLVTLYFEGELEIDPEDVVFTDLSGKLVTYKEYSKLPPEEQKAYVLKSFGQCINSARDITYERLDVEE